jgi:anti-sigma factor RsiW
MRRALLIQPLAYRLQEEKRDGLKPATAAVAGPALSYAASMTGPASVMDAAPDEALNLSAWRALSVSAKKRSLRPSPHFFA